MPLFYEFLRRIRIMKRLFIQHFNSGHTINTCRFFQHRFQIHFLKKLRLLITVKINASFDSHLKLLLFL